MFFLNKLVNNKKFFILFSTSPLINFLITYNEYLGFEIFITIIVIVLFAIFINEIIIFFKKNFLFYLFNILFFLFFSYESLSTIYYLINLDIVFDYFFKLTLYNKYFGYIIDYKPFNSFYYLIIILSGFLVFFIIKKKKLVLFNKIIIYSALISYSIIFIQLLSNSFIQYGSTSKDRDKEIILSDFKFKHFQEDFVIMIFDEYGQNSVFKKYYNFDNSIFLQNLKKEGFKIFNDSKTHTSNTDNFIPSLLELNKKIDKKNVWNMGSHKAPLLFKIFAENNYGIIYNGHCNKYTTVKNMFSVFKDQTICKNKYLSTHLDISMNKKYFKFISERYLFKILPLTSLTGSYQFFNNLLLSDMTKSYITGDINYFTKNFSSKVSKIKKKKFVYSYSLQPHAPFFYNEYCANNKKTFISLMLRDQKKINNLYFEQLKCINKNILLNLQLFKKNLNDPIIILMSDHGTRFGNETDDEKKKNFLAIKSPENSCIDISEKDTTIDIIYKIIKCL